MASIRVEGVSKSYRRRVEGRGHTWQEAFIGGFRPRSRQDAFWALRDVSLAVTAGEVVGVIGRNGAGKSSLLRLVGGVGRPEAGRIVVEGRLGALIDLGAGFHPELTGRENIYMNGVIAGLRRHQVTAILDDIVSFAELEPFLDSPLRTYSSGMQLRLAFAVAVHVQPEVLLVDEVLAVGDLLFQQKCLERIGALQRQGAAILFVTHDLAQAEAVCSRLVWLNGGRVAAAGDPSAVVGAYRAAAQQVMRERTPPDQPDERTSGGETLVANRNRFGSLEVRLEAVQLADRRGVPVAVLPEDRSLAVQIGWRTTHGPRDAIFGVGIYNAEGLLLCELFSPVTPLAVGQGQATLTVERLDLAPGAYRLDAGVYPPDWAYAYDYHWRAYALAVEGAAEGKGPLRPPHRWTCT